MNWPKVSTKGILEIPLLWANIFSRRHVSTSIRKSPEFFALKKNRNWRRKLEPGSKQCLNAEKLLNKLPKKNLKTRRKGKNVTILFRQKEKYLSTFWQLSPKVSQNSRLTLERSVATDLLPLKNFCSQKCVSSQHFAHQEDHKRFKSILSWAKQMPISTYENNKPP